ncbi:amidase [Acidisoma cellulosilytica]|uniref:Amidase n=1 Tax=Acidisoma cellulosilyticum TaxID=2802395 RepID=A0A963Z4C7_9PROT|nr:amidase [Acidisoma cellulosilyticum]MCB8882589.1 amidase [Acidisoma cellulosilyticum]
MNQSLDIMTAVGAAAAIRDGTMTVEDFARGCLQRMAAREDVLKAWAYVDPAAVLRQARELDKTPSLGALHGLPIGIKDIIDTRDMPTCHNSPIYVGNRPSGDAPLVETLRAAGALIIGKTETTEFAAAGRDPSTRNPFDPTRTSGGSSAGSAAAVGDGQIPLSIGTQTGGSTIRPASFCGVHAMKPSWGTISREGVKVYSLTLDTIGLYGRSIADLDLLAEVFGIGEKQQIPASVSGLRLAFCRSPEWEATEPPMREAFARAEDILRNAGAHVSTLDLPEPFNGLPAAHKTILFREGRTAFLNLYRAHHEILHEDFRHRVENRDGFTDQMLVAAYDLAAHCRTRFDSIAAEYDAVLTPSAPGEAPKGSGAGNPALNHMWTLLHAPCINVPGLKSAAGLPLGITVTGSRYADRQLLAVASAIDQAIAAAI